MNVKDTLIEIQELEETNRILRKENDNLILEVEFLKRQNNALKNRCSDYSLRLTKAETELSDIKHMSMWGFTKKYCTDDELEEAGHALARELLGKPMTEEELKIEQAENAYVPYVGDDF